MKGLNSSNYFYFNINVIHCFSLCANVRIFHDCSQSSEAYEFVVSRLFESIISHIQNIFKRVFLEIKNYLTDNLYKHNLCDHYHTMHLFFRANHKNENDPLRNVKSKNEIEKRKGVIGITRLLREKRSYSTVDFLLL